MSNISSLDAINFHDLPLDEIRVKLEHPIELDIRFSIYDDMRKDYNLWSLRLLNISQLNFSEVEIGDKSDFEIFSFEYSYDDFFKGKMTCLSGFGAPSFLISFVCSSYALKKIGTSATNDRS